MACCSCVLYIAFLIAIPILLKLYFKLRVKYNRCYNCLVGKTVIVTGANTGIGYLAALDFAARGGRVILACRNKQRAEDAVERIKTRTGNDNVVYRQLDLASLKSVREFAKNIDETEERIDILVNNAGGIGFDNAITEDGLQMVLQINHVGPFLLTHLLLDKLKKTGKSRIVNVASMAAKFSGNMNLKHLNKDPAQNQGYLTPHMNYNNTKLCNILFTIELSKRLEGTEVTANCLHPGTINTDFFDNYPMCQPIVKFFGSIFFKTPLEGAQTTIYVALSNKLTGVSGKLFDNCTEIEMYPNAKDADKIKKLWDMTEDWAKLNENEKIK